jgi:hypothetical protein
MLTTAANNAWRLNVTVPDGVEATAQDGNVTLTGTVAYGRARRRRTGGLRADRPAQRQERHRDQLRRPDPVDVDLHVQRRWTAPRWFPTTAT